MIKRFWTDLWWLLLFAFAGMVISIAVSSVAMMSAPLTWAMHVTQWSQSLLLMLLPPILWARWHKKEPVRDVLWLRCPEWQDMLVVVVLVLCSLPALSQIEEWSKLLCGWVLPQSVMSWAEDTLVSQQSTYELLMSVQGVGGWLELILLMCVATAMGEEAMFRGALLRCFGVTPHSLEAGSWSRGALLRKALWVGFLFAAMHGDVLGLLPRWVMGTGLVYLLYVTRSLWCCILAHTVNNLCAVIEMKAQPEWLESLGGGWVAALSLLLTVVLSWLLVIEHRKCTARRDVPQHRCP